MRLTRQHHRKLVAEISVTPMLDLVFILLFAFMAALPLVSRSGALLDPRAPAAALPAIATEPAEIAHLKIHDSGKLTLDGELLTLDAAEERLRADRLAANPQLGVRVEIPPGQPVSKLSEVMAALARAGVRRTAFQTAETPP